MHFGDGVREVKHEYRSKTLPNQYLIGPFTSGHYFECQGKLDVMGIVFHPIGLFHLTGQGAGNFTNRMIPPESLLGEETEKLYATLTAQPSSPARFLVVEKFLIKFFEGTEVEKAVLDSILSFIDHNQQLPQVKEICLEFGIHRDTLRLMFLEKVGITPKQYLGLKRFMRAMGLAFLHPRWDLQDISFQAGFYDSPHFIREFKRYAGMTPGKFLRQYRGQDLPVSIFF